MNISHLKDCNSVFHNYKHEQLKPNVYLFDVLGNNVQTKGNSEWRKLGESIARHVSANNQLAVLVSTSSLQYLTSDDGNTTTNDYSTTSFEHEKRIYTITAIVDPAKVEQFLPEIIETEEFLFGLNVYLYFFKRSTTKVDQLLCDQNFLNEIKYMISNLEILGKLELKFELIAAVPDGLEMFWFNPVFLYDNNNSTKNGDQK